MKIKRTRRFAGSVSHPGKILQDELEARGLSAYGLAKFTGLSLNTIYRLTRPNGRFSLIRADTIERLCGALRVTPGELFEYKKPPAA